MKADDQIMKSCMTRWTVIGAALLLFGSIDASWAASTEESGGFAAVLFVLALLLLGAKVGGLLVERWRQPSVLGELLVGVVLGMLLPLFFGGEGISFVRTNPVILVLAEAGVLILLFDVGLESDLRALAGVGWSALLVALIGIITPLILGWGAAAWFFPEAATITHIFVGATLSTTSVGITARVLSDLGKLKSVEGRIILGAAVIDDVLGLIVLAIVSGLVAAAASEAAGISALTVIGIVLRAIAFLGITVGVGHVFSRQILAFAAWTRHHGMLLIFALAVCFTLAYIAELLGLADIIGAFAAGLLLDPYGEGVRTREEDRTLSEMLQPLSQIFVPLFFVLMGTHVHLESASGFIVLGFGSVLVVTAFTGKLVCALGVVQRGVNRLAVGIGMIPRGEVGLIFAGIGTSMMLRGQPVLSQQVFSAIVMMVLFTTLVTPLGLRWAFGRPIRGRA